MGRGERGIGQNRTSMRAMPCADTQGEPAATIRRQLQIMNWIIGVFFFVGAIGIYHQGFRAGTDKCELRQIANTVKLNEKRKAVPRADTADLLKRLHDGSF
jgi:hypothetical protein